MALELGRVRAVLWDMDDTLVDWRGAESGAILQLARGPFARLGVNEELVRTTYAQVQLENQASWRRDRVWWYIQDRLRLLTERLGTSGHLQPPMLADMFSAFVRDRLGLLPGALEAMRAARERGWKTAILTNGKVDVQQPKVERFRLQHEVDEVAITESLGAWKPDAEAFLRVCARLGVRPGEAVMVGDSLDFDIAPARKLGMQTVWVGGADPHQADLLVPAPGHLTAQWRLALA